MYTRKEEKKNQYMDTYIDFNICILVRRNKLCKQI